MLSSIKFMLRRYWYLIIIALLISAPLTYLGVYRTDQALILKGGATPFDDIVSIDTEYKTSGSFSTLYVVSMEKSTKLQNLITQNDPTIERYTMSKGSQGVSDIDLWKASKIQYESSVYNAIILAYNEAKKEDSKINISYELLGFDITAYGEHSRFRIADRIVKIEPYVENYSAIYPSNESKFREVINKRFVGDKYTVLRDNKEMEITIEKEDTFNAYSMYSIDKEKTFPKFEISDSKVGGPSGGLLQTLSIYNKLVSPDYTSGLKIAGTGTIAYNGNVGAIGGIKEKIPTAIDNHIDVFFCPSVNYDDAKEAYDSLPNSKRMKLVKIDTFYDALNYLKELKKNGS